MREDIKERIEMMKKGKVPAGYKKTKLGIVPKDWQVLSIKDCLERVDNAVVVGEEEEYVQIGIRSHGKGIFYKDPVTGKELGNKRVFWIEPNCFIVNIVFAWEQAIGRTTEEEQGLIASHRFPMYKSIKDKVDVDYLVQYFLTQKGKDVMEYASPGGAGRNRTLGQDRFMKSLLVIPSIGEQYKIVEILALYEKKIGLFQKLVQEMELLKDGLVESVFKQNMRFGEEKNTLDTAWKEKSVDDVTEFIRNGYSYTETESQEYLPISRIETISNRTIDMNKIGRAKPPIDEQYRLRDGDILFSNINSLSNIGKTVFFAQDEVLYHGMNLLCIRPKDVNSKYLYYALNTNHVSKLNKIHAKQAVNQCSIPASDIKKYKLRIPCIEEQNKIADFFTVVDKKIELLEKQLEQTKLEKKAMMQLLLSGIVRAN